MLLLKNVKIFHNSEGFDQMCSSDCAEDVYRNEVRRVHVYRGYVYTYMGGTCTPFLPLLNC